LDATELARMVRSASAAFREGLHYPSRWIYCHACDGSWLELSNRWGRPAAGYPGALAIRGGTRLAHARQSSGSLYRVDFRSRNTDPWRSRHEPVDATVRVDQAILHFSWARSEEDLRTKAVVSGHAEHFDWTAAIDKWRWRCRHPRLASLGTPLRGRPRLGSTNWVRRTHLAVEPQMFVADCHPDHPSDARGQEAPGG
jgi:hypothetical protein